MWRVTMILTSGLLMVLLGGPGLASAGHVPFEGSWVAVDDFDGSNMTLEITRRSGHSFDVVLVDEGASICGWDPENPSPGFEATVTGTGGGGRNVLSGAYSTLVCADGSTLFGFRFSFTYDPDTDTLTEFFGQVWHRAP